VKEAKLLEMAQSMGNVQGDAVQTAFRQVLDVVDQETAKASQFAVGPADDAAEDRKYPYGITLPLCKAGGPFLFMKDEGGKLDRKTNQSIPVV
jgi:guanyl-specific ribonuclease Sa